VVIAGSTSVQPFAEVLAADYETDFGGSPVDVQGGGSGQGIIAAREGIADIGMSSRPIRRSETDCTRFAADEKSCYERDDIIYGDRCGGCARIVTIALDGLALIVHPSNPIVNLTLKEIRDIYTRELTNWSELGWNTAPGNGDIHVVTREEGSGTRGAFEEMVMQWSTRSIVDATLAPVDDCEDCQNSDVQCEEHTGTVRVFRDTSHSADIHWRTSVLNTNGAIRQFVAGNPNAIGYISLGTVEIPGLDAVKGLEIDGVAPSTVNVVSGSYGLFRPFIFMLAENPMHETIAFVNFILSSDGQDILEQKGLVSSPYSGTTVGGANR
jgi:phosphate transport system substrate-binding protein